MHDITGHILGMDTQIIFIRQRQQGGLVGGTQSDFHGGTVFDQPRNQPPDVIGGFEFRRFPDGQ